ncbi:MAG: hypothetical protein ABI649_06390 [Gaiellaceae bacterium]
MRRDRSIRVVFAAVLATVVMAALGGSAGASTFTIVPGGPAVTVTISTAGTSATASFSGSAGQRVSLNISSSTIALSKVSLLKPNGLALFAINMGKSPRFVDTQTLPSTGTYKLVINPNSTYTGKMTLRLYNVPPDATGTLTTDGTPTTIATGTPGQNAALTFAGTTGQRVALNVTSVTTSLANVSVLNPDGTTLVNPITFASSGTFVDPKTLPQDGTYTVFLNPKLMATGSVTVQAYVVPADTSAAVTADGTPTTGTTTVPGQAARFTFSGTAAGRVSLSVTGTDFTGKVSILKPDSALLTSRNVTPAAPAGAFIEAQTLPVTGTYTVLVDPGGDATGSLTFALYNVPPDTTAPITAGGSAVTVTSSQPGQNGYLTFTGTLNERISVLVSNVTVASARLNVLKPDGTPLLASPVAVSPAGAYLDVKVLPVAGNYKILIDPEGASVGSADVNLYVVPADLTGSIAATGAATTVTTTAPGQNAKLSFSGTAGQRVSLNLTGVTIGASACCSVKVAILKPDGTQLASKTVGTDGGFFEVATLAVAGTYKVLVDPQQAAFGSITLKLYTVPADTTGTASAGVGATVTTTVPGQNATRTFSGVLNQRVSFNVTGVTMPSVKVKITRPDGLSLVSDTFTTDGGFIEPKTLPLGGTYKITVDPQAASTGSITVTFYVVSADVTASANVGGSASLTLSTPGQNGKITFNGNSGQTVRFTASNVTIGAGSPSSTVGFQVYLTAGNVPVGGGAFSGTGGTSWDVPLTTTGAYYIEVDPIGAYTGGVTVGLQAL